MICRGEYRGCIKRDINEEEIKSALTKAKEMIEIAIQSEKLLQVSMYRFQNMCFLYCEAEEKLPQPENFLTELNPFLEDWPEEEGKRKWVFMYPVYYHSIPGDTNEWRTDRKGKMRIGRIAFLKKDKWASYVYWHHALVEEGLFCGDQFQFISLHENILFSYFEEPKTMVNIQKRQEESKVIEKWMNCNPKTYFEREKTDEQNFYIMEQL